MLIESTCEACNNKFYPDTREIKRGGGRFCSRTCSASRPRKSKSFTTTCGVCENIITITPSRYKKSVSKIFYCTTEHRIRGVIPGPKPSSNFRCKVCKGKTKSTTNICRNCDKENLISEWLNGNIEVTRNKGKTKEPRFFVKEYLKKTRGDSCEKCGYDKKRPDGTSKIQMDHIDGNYLNNSIDNLRLLCPNCHEDTPTMGSKNTGNGRAYRNK